MTTTLGTRANLRPNTSLRLPEFGSTPTQESRPVAINLMETVRNAVRDVDETSLRPVARRDSGLAYYPRTMLALMVCCYARGIYGSAAIERVMHKDMAFRALCHDEFPDAQMLRRFRRKNRPAVQCCLSKVLRLTSTASSGERGHDCWSLEQSDEEAARRLDMAACMDALDLEP